MHFLFGFYLTSTIISTISASPSLNKRDNITTTVKLINQCDDTIHVGQLGDTILNNGNLINITSGSSETYQVDGNWSGRFWAREACEASGCPIAGAAFPASLAEFTFQGNDGKDFYDISFVDGYNLPIRIDPVQLKNTTDQSSSETGKYWCAAPSCSTTPPCPDELQLPSANACLSACSKFGNPEYCCSGAHNTLATCPINEYAAAVKRDCPDVYSYAYDDASSLYQCRASGYSITWCPK